MMSKCLVLLLLLTLVCSQFQGMERAQGRERGRPVAQYRARDGRIHQHAPNLKYTLQLGNAMPAQKYVDDFPNANVRAEIKPVPPVLKNSKESTAVSGTFEEYWRNITYPNMEWVNWKSETLLIAITTDKPVYKPGDTMEAMGYLFNYTDKSPGDCEDMALNLEIKDSNENIVYSKAHDYNEKCTGNSVLFEYKIPKDMKGGVYFLKIYDYSIPTSIVKFRVREYHQKQLVTFDYSQESYNPGDQVEGKLTLRTVDDGPITETAVFDINTIGGEQKKNIPISKDGFGYFTFKIPSDWKEGSFFVSFILHVGANESTKSDILTVVQGDTLHLEFTGESGPIINNACHKIYFEAFSDESKAEHVDISNAQLFKKSNGSNDLQALASGISTQFHGRGYFELCTEEKTQYFIKYKGVDHAIDVEKYNKNFEYKDTQPETKVLLKLKNSVLSNGHAIELTIINQNSDKKVDMNLVVFQKKTMLYTQKVSLNGRETNVKIEGSKLKLPNGGVISVSLFESQQKKEKESSNQNERIMYNPFNFPYLTVAEALVFILPSNSLDVKLKTDKDTYSPGETVNYEITVVDKSTGKKVKDDVYVSLGVTDLSAFLEVENKRQPPSIVSKVYLEKEVNVTKEYEFLNANEFLNYIYQTSDDYKNVDEAKKKIQLLLGTQGWRLFQFDPTIKRESTADTYSLKNLLMESQPNIMYMNARGGAIMEMAPMMAMAEMADMGAAPQQRTVAKNAAPPPPSPSPPQSPIMKKGETEVDASKADKEKIVEKGEDSLTAERVDFKQTQLFTKFAQAKDGKYKGSFKLTDVITKFRFTINAVSKSGVYGISESYFNSKKDFYIESNIPFFLTSQDKISVPVVIHNNRDKDLTVDVKVSTSLTGDELEYSIAEPKVTVAKHSTKQVIVSLKAKRQTFEDFEIKLDVTCGNNCTDSFKQSSKIIGRGFPVTESQSGFIGSSDDKFVKETTLAIPLPGTFEEGSLELKAKVFTSKLSHIVEALEKLIRDPHGCFEQTSSTTYPLVMALSLMKNMPEKDEKTTQMMIEGKQKLTKGYERLLTFETETGGYEWFGTSPGHEALSAYGLMQFHEMKDVISDVDQGMIDRVTSWVLSKRDGKGSFTMSSAGLDSFGHPPPDISDAYILWVLTSIGNGVNLDTEIKAAIEKAKASGDSYLNALVANILYNVGRDNEAREIAKIVKSHQDKQTGEVQRKETSITRSSGVSLNVETTALAILAWMKDKTGVFADSTELGVKFITASVKDGKYGSTQGTILSLKVLVEYLKNSKLEGEGTFEVYLDDKMVKSIPFSKDSNTTTVDFTEDLGTYLHSNLASFKKQTNHTVKVQLKNFKGDEKKFRLSYAISATYKDLTPKSNKNSDLEFSIKSSSDAEDAKIGEVSQYTVKLRNKDSSNGKGMTLAIVRIPSCQEVDFNSLERLQNENKVSYFEVFNGNTDVVLYWRSMQPSEIKEVQVKMTQVYKSEMCIFRPSVAYLYYDEDGSQVWTE